MSTTSLTLFEKILEKFISEAHNIPCTPEEYLEGLEYSLEEIEMEIDAIKKSCKLE